MKLNARSETNLKRVHPDLVKVVRCAAEQITEPDFGFIVTSGPRTIEQQRELFKKGATRTMRSRHLIGKDGFCYAVDLAAWIGTERNVKWDWPLYARLAKIMKQAAKDVKVPIEWGGDWKSFKDGPHFQLPVARYPG
jgi:peptidoglycan L-alanyl-D-glutamate endopeptidase CwlK